MSTKWRGGHWTAGDWDANNWLGPNQPPPAGSISGSASITFSATGTLEAGNTGFISGSATLSLTASGTLTAEGIAPPIAQVAGGGGFVSVRRKRREQDALTAAIQDALRGPVTAEKVERVLEVAARDAVAPDTSRWTLPQPKDYRTEEAHLAALADAVARVTARITQQRAAEDELQRKRKERAAQLVKKVRAALKLAALADLADAA